MQELYLRLQFTHDIIPCLERSEFLLERCLSPRGVGSFQLSLRWEQIIHHIHAREYVMHSFTQRLALVFSCLRVWSAELHHVVNDRGHEPLALFYDEMLLQFSVIKRVHMPHVQRTNTQPYTIHRLRWRGCCGISCCDPLRL